MNREHLNTGFMLTCLSILLVSLMFGCGKKTGIFAVNPDKFAKDVNAFMDTAVHNSSLIECIDFYAKPNVYAKLPTAFFQKKANFQINCQKLFVPLTAFLKSSKGYSSIDPSVFERSDTWQYYMKSSNSQNFY